MITCFSAASASFWARRSARMRSRSASFSLAVATYKATNEGALLFLVPS